MNGAKKEKSSHVDNIKKEYNNTKRLFRSQIKKVVCIDGENINQEMYQMLTNIIQYSIIEIQIEK